MTDRVDGHLKWSEINQTLEQLTQNLEHASARIQVARKEKQQIYHKNQRKWYASRIRVVRGRFLIMKRRFAKDTSIAKILRDFEVPLRVLCDLQSRRRSDIEAKWNASRAALLLLGRLSVEIRRREQRAYDVLPRYHVERDDRLCFVIMPFNPRKFFNPVYGVIRRAAQKKHMKCVRSDNLFDTRAVVWDIWESIRKARVCIADISNMNPNVFYELGMAHSVITRTILISRKLEKEEKHVFDVNYVRCVYYENTKSGLQTLSRDISKTLSTILR